MVRRGFLKMSAITLAFGLALALVTTGCSSDVSPDIGWIVNEHPEGLSFTFNAPVSGLSEEHIIITPHVPRGTIYGGGTTWILPISAYIDDTLRISINRSGISSRAQEITLEGDIDTGLTSLTAADFDRRTGEIRLEFDNPVAGLARGNISIRNVTGEATVAGLRGFGEVWYLDVNIQRSGDVEVHVDRFGMRPGEDNEWRLVTDVNKVWPTFGFGNDASNTATVGSEISIGFDRVTVTSLTAAQVRIRPHTAVISSGLSAVGGQPGVFQPASAPIRRGSRWYVPITVETYGDIYIWIDRTGFAWSYGTGNDHEPERLDTTVQSNELESVVAFDTYGLGTNIDANMPPVTDRIHFTFSAPITNLTLDQIDLRRNAWDLNPAGMPTLREGSITGSGRFWSVGLNVPQRTQTPAENFTNMQVRVTGIAGFRENWVDVRNRAGALGGTFLSSANPADASAGPTGGFTRLPFGSVGIAATTVNVGYQNQTLNETTSAP